MKLKELIAMIVQNLCIGMGFLLIAEFPGFNKEKLLALGLYVGGAYLWKKYANK